MDFTIWREDAGVTDVIDQLRALSCQLSAKNTT